MEILLISVAAFLVSGLTLISGFGLGTLLMPVFALYFPLSIAIALTAIVHLANNLFKLALFYPHTHWQTVLRFGIPAIIAAFIGAWLLTFLETLAPLYQYTVLNHLFKVTLVNLVIGSLIIAFAILEALPAFEKMAFEPRYLTIGGILSGFFGGLSGHQGQFRSAFLIKCALNKQQFLATGIIIACLVDFTRLSLYSNYFIQSHLIENSTLLIIVTLSAFSGAFLATRLIEKITLTTVKRIVSIMLFFTGFALMVGLI